jgi:hypothetical protein
MCAVLLLSFCLPALAAGQGTYTEGVTRDARRNYAFTTTAPGQVIATLSWDNQAADLFLILVCTAVGSSAEPLTYGVAGGQLDRTARLESGIVGASSCILGVSTFDEAASFRLNLQVTSAQSASLRDVPLRDARTEAKLLEHAAAVFRTLQSQR